MRKLKLLIAAHGHQPIGNFDWVLEDSYEKCYKPFIEYLYKYPYIKIALHFSGYLLDWLVNHDESLGKMLEEMVSRKQIEMMGGGYYEPILSVIPQKDKEEQIRKLSKYLKKLVHKSPKGFWLAERVWEPHLTEILADTGMEYLLTDDSHFRSAGLKQDDLYGHYVTEENGKKVSIFPINQKLRYLIPFHSVDEVFSYLKELHEKGAEAAILGDDTEKFGIWPGTHELVYKKGWLKNFYEKIEENKDWLEISTFQKYLSDHEALGLVYLPAASYSEMMEWVMPSEDQHLFDKCASILDKNQISDYNRFLKGGYWRNFFVKYPESNNMQKKMVWLSKKIEAEYGNSSRASKALENSYEYILKSQVNCPYWHGVFGGLYLTNLRTAVHQNLVLAQRELEKHIYKQNDFTEMYREDINFDGKEEIIFNSNDELMLFSADYGGALFDWSLKKTGFNLLDTLSRKREAYHKTLIEYAEKEDNSSDDTLTIHHIVKSKEKGLEKLLHYDKYLKYSYLDYCLVPDTSFEDMYKNKFTEVGKFAGEKYSSTIFGKNERIIFKREAECSGEKISVRKIFRFKDPAEKSHTAEYLVENTGNGKIKFKFAVELNYNLLTGSNSDRYFLIGNKKRLMGTKFEGSDIKEINIKDEWLKAEIDISMSGENGEGAGLFVYPVESVSQSESGFERVYQGTGFVLHWNLELNPGEKWSYYITQKISEETDDN